MAYVPVVLVMLNFNAVKMTVFSLVALCTGMNVNRNEHYRSYS